MVADHRKLKAQHSPPQQRTSTVVYLGPMGTFSHLVALRRFSADVKMVAGRDIASIFDYLLAFPESKAVVPIENSSGGAIYETVDFLMANAGSIRILEELSLDVRLALLGHGRGKTEIRRIYSHFVPLRHHRDWLAKHFPHARTFAVNSTALAAKKASGLRDAAALASPDAAALYGLQILQFPLAPETVNVTRFFVIGQEEMKMRASPRWKTSAIFRLKNSCGSLHAFLGAFAHQGVNLRMIISRPLRGSPERYVFVMEVDGAIEKPLVEKAFQDAAVWCEKLSLLGSYPCRFRYAPSKSKK